MSCSVCNVCMNLFAMAKLPLPSWCFLHCRERVSLCSLEEGRAEVHELGDDWTGWQRKWWVLASIAQNQLTLEFCLHCWCMIWGFLLPSNRWKHHLQQRPNGILHPGQHGDAHRSKIPGRSVSVRHLVVMPVVSNLLYGIVCTILLFQILVTLPVDSLMLSLLLSTLGKS